LLYIYIKNHNFNNNNKKELDSRYARATPSAQIKRSRTVSDYDEDISYSPVEQTQYEQSQYDNQENIELKNVEKKIEDIKQLFESKLSKESLIQLFSSTNENERERDLQNQVNVAVAKCSLYESKLTRQQDSLNQIKMHFRCIICLSTTRGIYLYLINNIYL